jgi:hypothetical protein
MAGIAVHSFNCSPLAHRLGMKLCLLEDPCFAIVPNENFVPLDVPFLKTSPTERSVSPTTMANPIANEANLLREAIADLTLHDRRFDASKAGSLEAALLSYLECYEEAGQLTEDEKLIGLDAALLDYLSTFPVLAILFDAMINPGTVSEDGICPTCDAPARTLCVTFPRHGAKPHKIIRCACCFDSSNLPLDWQIKLDLSRISEKTLSISGVPEGAQILICLNIIPTTLLHAAYPWSSLNGHWPSFTIPEQKTAAPLCCQLVIARRLEIGTLGFKLTMS